MVAKNVSQTSFDSEVLQSSEPVLVDFWAEWCGPCKQLSPTLDEIAAEMEGKVTIAKVNIDENQDIAVKYGVRAIPMLALFKDGELAGTQVGVQPKSRLVSWINDTI
ncbi:MAG: thioredoxin [Rhodobiaceae bacterium]|nr:thioredoxin [Rhodobiaceae bacterium]MCC0055268.1 thioredoxin [Rhodobiaceae bacterium]